MLIYYTILIVLIVTGVRLYPSTNTDDLTIEFYSPEYDELLVVRLSDEIELTEEGYIVIGENIYVPFIERTVNLHDI